MTKHNYLVRDADELPRVVAEAFHIARTGRPGPVHIDITKDALQQETRAEHPTEDEIVAGLPGFRPNLDGHGRQLKTAATEIANAKRPVILAGHGVLHAEAWDDLRAFAEKTSIPVAWTLLGIGAMDETHPLAYGFMGMHGWKHVNRAIQSADLLIAIGMRFDDRVTGNVRTYAPYARIIHVDIDPAEIGKNVAVEVPIVGDAKRVLQALTPMVPATSADERREYLDQLAEWRRDSEASSWHGSGAWRDGVLSADYVVERIGELTDHQATYVADVGQNQMWLARYTGFRNPNSHVSSGGLGTMGFSVPAAMGAALGRPDRETWAITGDGGFQMTFQELMTLVADDIPVKIALLDNKKLGMIRQWQEIIYAGNYHSANLPGPDFAKLADAFGIPAFRARTPGEVDDAIRAAQAVDGPALDLVRDRRGAERLPDDAGRQGPVGPDREVGRGGRMSARSRSSNGTGPPCPTPGGDPGGRRRRAAGPGARRPAASLAAGRRRDASACPRGHRHEPARRPQPGLEPDARPQLQHRLAGRQQDRPRGHQPDDDHAARGRRGGRAGRQAALPADRRAQGPGRHLGPDRGARARVREDPRDRFQPRRGAPARRALARPGRGPGRWLGHRGGDRHRVRDRHLRVARADVRHQGVGPHRRRRDGEGFGVHRGGDTSDDERTDVLRQRLRTRRALAGQTVAIIGYGSQGHAHALNLHESGVDVIVGLAPGSKSRALASDAGLRVSDVADAVRDADVVMILVPDTSQKAVYDAEIGPHLRAGHLLMFAHGFNLRFGRIDPPGIVDVGMVAPKGPGHLLRSVYQAGGGVPALFAVERDQSGTARDRVLAYARAIGSTRAGVLETTFAEETETDLFGEQSVLCGGTSALVKMAFETLVEAGYQPELAYFETMHELKLIVDLMYRGGLNFMRFSVSDTAEYGDYVSGPRLIDESVRERMQAVLKDIQDGSFANRWIEENETGRHEFERLRQADHDHLIERVGGRLRAQMPFLNPVEVQAGQAQAAATTPGAAR